MRALYLTTASTPTPPASLRQACPWPWRSRTAPHGFFPLIQGEKDRFVILGEQWTLQERWNVERPHTACRIAKGLSTLHRGAQLLSGRKIKNHLSRFQILWLQESESKSSVPSWLQRRRLSLGGWHSWALLCHGHYSGVHSRYSGHKEAKLCNSWILLSTYTWLISYLETKRKLWNSDLADISQSFMFSSIKDLSVYKCDPSAVL